MTWPYPHRIAHRGGGALAPENTLLALATGWQHGYRAAEVDAALTADGIAVLLHDATLDRTTSGHGSLADCTAATVQSFDAGSWLDARFAAARVPTLVAALDFCRTRGIWLNVEIKPVPGFERATGTVVARTVAAFQGGAAASPAQVLLSSFSRVALEAARAEAPGLPRGLLCTRVAPAWADMLAALDAVSLHCDHRPLSARTAAAVKAAGYGLACYTVNAPERAEQLAAWGVDAVFTDRIDILGPD